MYILFGFAYLIILHFLAAILPPPPPTYSSVCNTPSTSHGQTTLCNNQRYIASKSACSAFYATSSISNCSNNCNQVAHHSSIPHSKSLDHYNNEPTKLIEHHNVSRHSFDQPFSSTYKNYDCTDGIHASDYMHQPTCSLQNTGNIYNVSCPLPAFPDHHYAQIGNIERGENFVETNMGTCCHQNPHYECLSNFNTRSSVHKSKNGVDYSNCSFQTK